MTEPGDYLIVLGDHLPYRAAGWEVRDCFLALLHGPRVLPAWFLRAPMSNTVTEAMVRHRRGALNIEACRVQGGLKQITAGRRTIKWGVGEGGSSYEKGTGAIWTSEGRWPTNVLIIHGPKCRKIADSDGIGTPVWSCEPGCSAPLLAAEGGSKFYPQFVDLAGALDWLAILIESGDREEVLS